MNQLPNFDVNALKVTGFAVIMDLYVPYGDTGKPPLLEVKYRVDDEAVKGTGWGGQSIWHPDFDAAKIYPTFEAAKAEIDRLLSLPKIWKDIGGDSDGVAEEQLIFDKSISNTTFDEFEGECKFQFRYRAEPRFDEDSMPFVLVDVKPEYRKKEQK
jgi:hypothetical protein